jgi:Xaa-Pro aminopeptidase
MAADSPGTDRPGTDRAEPFTARMDRVRRAMADRGVDVLLLSVGADLPWLCGYEAMPLERLTMLVVPRDGDATLVVPALEAP